MFFNKKVWGGLSATVIQKNQIIGNETKNIRGGCKICRLKYQYKVIKKNKFWVKSYSLQEFLQSFLTISLTTMDVLWLLNKLYLLQNHL